MNLQLNRTLSVNKRESDVFFGGGSAPSFNYTCQVPFPRDLTGNRREALERFQDCFEGMPSAVSGTTVRIQIWRKNRVQDTLVGQVSFDASPWLVISLPKLVFLVKLSIVVINRCHVVQFKTTSLPCAAKLRGQLIKKFFRAFFRS